MSTNESNTIETKSESDIIDGYPVHIVAGYHEMMDAKDQGSGYNRFLPLILRYWTIILAQDFSRFPTTSPTILHALSELFSIEDRDAEGDWLKLICAIALSFCKDGITPFVPELVDNLYDRRSASPQEEDTHTLLYTLLHERNNFSHGKPTPPVEWMRTKFTELMTLNPWMGQYILSLHLRVPTGNPPTDEYAVHGKECLSSFSRNLNLDGELILHSPKGEQLSLDPMVILRPCKDFQTIGHNNPSEIIVFKSFGHANKAWFCAPKINREIDDENLVDSIRQKFDRIRVFTADSAAKDPYEFVKTEARRITNESIESLVISKKFLEDVFVEPPIWNDQLWAFLKDSRPGLLLKAPAGAGKSSLMCHTAKSLMEQGIMVVFWNAADPRFKNFQVTEQFHNLFKQVNIRKLNRILDFVRDNAPKPNDFPDITKLVIMVDAPNETKKPERVLDEIVSFVRDIGIAKFGGVTKVIVAIRDLALSDYKDKKQYDPFDKKYFFDVTPKDSETSTVEVPIIDFTAERFEILFKLYQKKFKFTGLPQMMEFLKHPLMLRLTAESFKGMPLPTVLSKELVWEKYIKERIKVYKDISDVLRLTLDKCADTEYETAKLTLNKSDIRDWLLERTNKTEVITKVFSVLLHEGFLMEGPEEEEQIEGFLMEGTEEEEKINEGNYREVMKFTFEEFGEFLMGIYIIPKRIKLLGLQGVFSEIAEKDKVFPRASEVLKFFMRDKLRQDMKETSDVFHHALIGREDIGRKVIGELLGEYEANHDIVHADKILEMITRIDKSHARVVLKASIDWDKTFDTGIGIRLIKMGKMYMKCLNLPQENEEAARTCLWMGDIYYNREDKYKSAIRVLKEGLQKLESCDEESSTKALTVVRTKYFLGRVLSDSGYPKEAEKYAQELEQDQKNGLALSKFLIYMIHGDGGGLFKKALPYLETSKNLFNENKDNRSLARIEVNMAIALMCTSTREKALEQSKTAIAECLQKSDIQGRAYAYLNDAAICIQKGALSTEDVQNALFERASNSLDEAMEIFKVTGEDYLHTMIKANKSVLALMKGENEQARTLLAEVIAEANESKDFFNRFDAEVILAGSLDQNQARLLELEVMANKKDYLQGKLHVYWQLARLKERTGDKSEHERYASLALEVAKELGWGDDPRESLYMGFYAGLYI